MRRHRTAERVPVASREGLDNLAVIDRTRAQVALVNDERNIDIAWIELVRNEGASDPECMHSTAFASSPIAVSRSSQTAARVTEPAYSGASTN